MKTLPVINTQFEGRFMLGSLLHLHTSVVEALQQQHLLNSASRMKTLPVINTQFEGRFILGSLLHLHISVVEALQQ